MEHMLIPPGGQMRNYSGHYLSLSQKLECDIWDHSTWRLKGTSEDFPWRSNAELLWAIFLSLSVKSLKRFWESCNNICQLLHSLKGASLLSHLHSSQKGKHNDVFQGILLTVFQLERSYQLRYFQRIHPTVFQLQKGHRKTFFSEIIHRLYSILARIRRILLTVTYSTTVER